MNRTYRLSLLSGVILLIGTMIFGDISFWQYGYGEDSPRPSNSYNHNPSAPGQMMTKNNKNKKTSEQDKKKEITKKNENEKRNNELRFWKPALGKEDEDRFNNNINHVPQWQRLNVLISVIGRIAKLEINIGNSNMLPERKTYFLDMLEAIRILVQQRIDELTGTGSMDVTPPTVSAFSAIGMNMNSATFSTTVSEAGTGYYVLLASGSTAPTAAQVKLWQDASGSLANIHGSTALVNGTNTFTVSGLTAGQTYTIYFGVADLHGNLQTATFSLTFMTTNIADTTPPVLSALTFSGITTNSTNLSFASDEWGKAYYVLLASGSTAPTALQVKLGENAASGSVALAGSGTILSGSNMFVIPGLTSDTSYTLYLVAEDLSGNLTITPSNVSLTTLVADVTPPTITAFSATGATASGATFTATLSESGTGYYVILPNGSSAPSASQVKLGQDSTGTATSMKGSLVSSVWINNFSVTTLSPATTYIMFFTAEDMIGNLQPSVQATSFTTLSL